MYSHSKNIACMLEVSKKINEMKQITVKRELHDKPGTDQIKFYYLIQRLVKV